MKKPYYRVAFGFGFSDGEYRNAQLSGTVTYSYGDGRFIDIGKFTEPYFGGDVEPVKQAILARAKTAAELFYYANKNLDALLAEFSNQPWFADFPVDCDE